MSFMWTSDRSFTAEKPFTYNFDGTLSFPNSTHHSTSIGTNRLSPSSTVNNYHTMQHLLPKSAFSLCDAYEEPPRVSDTYLQATSRVLTRKDPKQGQSFISQHEDNSQRLAGHHADLGMEQHPEALKDFLDKKQQECHMALLESERSSRAESRRQNNISSATFEWDQFKERALMDDLAAGGCGMLQLLRKQNNQAGLQRNRLTSAGDRPMTTEEIIFARVVREYNDDRLKLRAHTNSLLARCIAAAESLSDKACDQFWHAAQAVVSDTIRDGDPQSVHQITPHWRLSGQFQTALIKNIRKYLEQSAWFQTETRLRTMVREPDLRGAPEMDTVVAYCRQQLASSRVKPEVSGKLLHGLPLWSLIYYSIRLGALKSAVKFCDQGDDACAEFVPYLKEYERNKGILSSVTETELRTLIRGNFDEDPYKQSVLSIVSRDDPHQDLAVVTQSVQDWLWTKLAQLDTDEQGGVSKLTLSALQDMVKSRFPAGKTDDTEAYLAFMLTGQFERAVERLFQNLKWRIHGVHLAMSFSELCLINVGYTAVYSGLLLTDETLPALDFSSIMRIYANGFRSSSTKNAMEYFYHLSATPAVRSSQFDHEFPNLFQFCVYKLASEGINLTELFGKLGGGAGAAVQQGLVHRFLQDPSNIVVAVAQDLVQNGKLEEGLVMYETVGEVTQLFRALLSALVDNLTCATNGEERRKYFVLATGYAEKYGSRASDDPTILQNFFVVLDLMTFFSLCDGQESARALQVIRTIKIIPLDVSEVNIMLVSYRDSLLPQVRECVPLTTLRTAQAIVSCYLTEKDRIMNARLGTDAGLPLRAVNQMISGARLSDELVKAQVFYKKQIRTLLDFTNKISSSTMPNLLDILIKLEASVS